MRQNWFFILCLASFFFACKHEPEQPFSSGYPDSIDAIFTKRACYGCHTTKNKLGGLDMSTWEHLFEGYEIGAVAIPYSSEWSHLFQHSNNDSLLGPKAIPTMPVYQNQAGDYLTDSSNILSESELITLKNWLEVGAPDKNGVVKWKEKENAGSGKFMFLNQASDILSVVDLDTKLMTRMVEIGSKKGLNEAPHYICASADKQFIFITYQDGGFIEKRRATDYSLIGKTPFIGASLAHVEASDDGKWLIATNHTQGNETGSAKMSIINAETMAINDRIDAPFSDMPHGLAVTKDFTTAYVSAMVGNYFTRININAETGKFKRGDYDIIDFALRQEWTPEPTASYTPYQCILNDAETRLYISCSQSHEVYCYDITNNDVKLLNVIATPSLAECSAGLGKSPRLMTLHNDKLFVVCATEKCISSANRTRSGCVSVINVANDANLWERNIYGLGHVPHGIAIDKKRNTLYVCCENQGTGSESVHDHGNTNNKPGLFNAVDLNSYEVLFSTPIDAAVLPSAALIIPE